MDEVELLLIKPQIFGIINDELEIWWDADLSSVFAQRPLLDGLTVLAVQDLDQCQSPGSWGMRRLPQGISLSQCIHSDGSLTHVNGPDTSAGANIKGISWILHRRKEEFAVESQVEQVMLQVQSICLALRLGQRHRPDDRVLGLKHGVPRRSERCISRLCTLQACQHQALGSSTSSQHASHHMLTHSP